MRLHFVLIAAALMASVSGCALSRSEWQYHRDLLTADELADDGFYEDAIDAYEVLSRSAHRDDFIRYTQYRIAYMHELLGDDEEALSRYAALYTRPTSTYDEYGSRACYRTGLVVRDDLGDPEEAYHIWAGVLRGFPNSAAADDALRELVRYARDTDQEAVLVSYLATIYPALRLTEVADNIAYWSGRLLEEDLEEYEGAIEMYSVVIRRFHRSGLWDDAQWRTGLSYRALGDTFMEYTTLDDFVRGREVSWVMADYDSAFYGPAYFRMAEINEEAGDWAAAVESLKRYQHTFPLSLQVDDVQYRIIENEVRLGDTRAMRRELEWLEDEYPRSRHLDEARRIVGAAL